MQRSAVFVSLGAVLVACFGASLYRSTKQPAAGQTQEPRPVRPLPKQKAPADLGERALAHVRAVVAFGARHPGTEGWRRQLDYIEAELGRLGLTPRRDTWTDRKELVTFTNVMATIAGNRKERILLACHHDTKCTQNHTDPAYNFDFVGANDGGSAVGLLLALAPILIERKNEATIELVFFDGEESLDWAWNEGARALFGSKRYVREYRDAQLLGTVAPIAALVLLDMVGRTDLHIQEETFSTPELREILWSAAVACGHERHFFRLAEAASDDHKPFLDVGIPAVDLIDLKDNPHWHKPTDTLENVSAASLQKVGEVVLTMLPAIESDYLKKG
jgi:Zn-dependent M28 family amino/carboxypeptidase